MMDGLCANSWNAEYVMKNMFVFLPKGRSKVKIVLFARNLVSSCSLHFITILTATVLS